MRRARIAGRIISFGMIGPQSVLILPPLLWRPIRFTISVAPLLKRITNAPLNERDFFHGRARVFLARLQRAREVAHLHRLVARHDAVEQAVGVRAICFDRLSSLGRTSRRSIAHVAPNCGEQLVAELVDRVVERAFLDLLRVDDIERFAEPRHRVSEVDVELAG
jgi:hypothetical protein